MTAKMGVRKRSGIFIGWWTVIAAGILCLWGYGVQGYGFSALFKPIAQDLGFSRATTSIAAAMARFEGGFEAPITGWVVDRFGPRVVAIPGIFVVGLGLILMYFINSLWSFLLVWGVITATGINVALSTPLDTAIANWFVRKRGMALSIKWVFSGLSGVIILPLVAWLIETYGWRITLVIGGLVMWSIGLPLAWFFLKPHRPEYYGLLPDGAAVKPENATQTIEAGVEYATAIEEVEFTLRQALRTRAYWLLIVVNSMGGLVSWAITIHLIPFLTDMGITPVAAAATMALMVFASIPMRFIAGLIADRSSRGTLRYLLGGAYFLQFVGLALFLAHQTMVTLYAFLIIYGFGMGVSYALPPTLRGRYFGRKAFGTIQGSSSFFLMPSGVIAPVYAGWTYDITGSYTKAFMVFAVLLALAVAVMCLVTPPKPPAKITGVTEFL